jgi:hypothetical protein
MPFFRAVCLNAFMEAGSMTAAEFEVLDEGEAESVLRWRLVELIGVGYSWDDALVLATHVEIDLHLAGDLLRRGCPSATALRILL